MGRTISGWDNVNKKWIRLPVKTWKDWSKWARHGLQTQKSTRIHRLDTWYRWAACKRGVMIRARLAKVKTSEKRRKRGVRTINGWDPVNKTQIRVSVKTWEDWSKWARNLLQIRKSRRIYTSNAWYRWARSKKQSMIHTRRRYINGKS